MSKGSLDLREQLFGGWTAVVLNEEIHPFDAADPHFVVGFFDQSIGTAPELISIETETSLSEQGFECAASEFTKSLFDYEAVKHILKKEKEKYA